MNYKKLTFNLINKLLAAYVMCLLLIAMGSSLLKSTFGMIIMQFIMLLIFLGLPFQFMKNLGHSDRERHMNGDIKEDLLKGLKLSGVCFALLEISALLPVLMKLKILPDAIYIYRILNPQFLGFAWFLTPEAEVLSLSWAKIMCFLLLPLLYPISNELAYLKGYRDNSWI